MRITQRMVLDRSIASVQKGLGEMARHEREITTGQRLQQLSDDPVSGRAVLDIDADLGRLTQLGRNIDTARARLAVEDATLQATTGILSRARELGIAQASGTANADTRSAAALEVAELRASVVQAASQTVTGVFVFGGAHVDRAPLDPAGALDPTAPARGSASYEIGPGQVGLGAHDAGQIFIDSDTIGALDALEAALLANDGPAIDTATDRIREAITGVQRLVAETGAREARSDSAEDANAALEGTLRTRRSALADAPIEEAVTRLAAAQATFQASLITTNRILETTLANYLR